MPFETQFGIWIDSTSLLAQKTPLVSPQVYEEGVRKILVKISHSKVGRVVLNTIRFQGRVVRIVPNVIDPQQCAPADTQDGDAFEFSVNKAVKMTNQVVSAGLKSLRGRINFTPGMYAKGGPCENSYRKRSQFTPTEDEVLLHELVHGARIASLKLKLQEATHQGLMMYDNDEEFFAVLVENIYLSELKSGHLRSSHTSFMEMDQNLQGSLKFFQVSGKAFEKVDQLATQNPGLARALANIAVPFNPLTAYFSQPAKAREMSKSAYAKMRDLGPIGMVFAPLLM
jgi:hypothetical protein